MKSIRAVVFYALCMAGGALAQAPASTPPSTPPVAKPAPVLSENEQLKMENLELKLSSIQQQAQQIATPLQQQRAELIAKIESEHPGFKWHESMGAGDAEGLRPISPPVEPVKPTPPTK